MKKYFLNSRNQLTSAKNWKSVVTEYEPGPRTVIVYNEWGQLGYLKLLFPYMIFIEKRDSNHLKVGVRSLPLKSGKFMDNRVHELYLPNIRRFTVCMPQDIRGCSRIDLFWRSAFEHWVTSSQEKFRNKQIPYSVLGECLRDIMGPNW